MHSSMIQMDLTCRTDSSILLIPNKTAKTQNRQISVNFAEVFTSKTNSWSQPLRVMFLFPISDVTRQQPSPDNVASSSVKKRHGEECSCGSRGLSAPPPSLNITPFL